MFIDKKILVLRFRIIYLGMIVGHKGENDAKKRLGESAPEAPN